ncbi:hypothetical protein BZA77DRAFT_358906 [Pyronema omphalodes]|nr:hypothetical protein BZA77DRAFT_358906 [Pyronema omphalodes]
MDNPFFSPPPHEQNVDITAPFNFESIVKKRLSSFHDPSVIPRSASMPVAQAQAQNHYRTTENYRTFQTAVPRGPKAMVPTHQNFHQFGAYGTQVYPPRIPEQGNVNQSYQRHPQAQVFAPQVAQYNGFPMGSGQMGSFDMSVAAGFQGQVASQFGQQFYNFETSTSANFRTVSQPPFADQYATQYKDVSPMAASSQDEGTRVSSLTSSLGPCIGTLERYDTPPPIGKPLVSAPPSRVGSVKRVPKPGPKAIPIVKPPNTDGPDDHEFPGLTSLIKKFKDYDFGDANIMPGYYDPSMISCRKKDDPLYCKPLVKMSDTPFCGACNEPTMPVRAPGDNDNEGCNKNDGKMEEGIDGLSPPGKNDESVAPKDPLAGLTWDMQRDQLTAEFKIFMMNNYPPGTKLSSTEISEVLAELSLNASRKLEVLKFMAEHVPFNSFDKTLGTPIKLEETPKKGKGKFADFVKEQKESVKSKKQAAKNATPIKATEVSPGTPRITIATTTADSAFPAGSVTKGTPKKQSNILDRSQLPSVTVTPVSKKKTHVSTLQTPKNSSTSIDYNSELTPDSLAVLRAFEAEQQEQLRLFSKKLAEDHEAAEKMLQELLPKKNKDGTPMKIPRPSPRASPLSKINSSLSKSTSTTSTPQAIRTRQSSLISPSAPRASTQNAILATIPKPCKELMDTYPKVQWACTSCRVIYSTERELLNHYEVEEHDWRFWCRWCDTIFDDLEKTQKHRCDVYVGEREWRQVC